MNLGPYVVVFMWTAVRHVNTIQELILLYLTPVLYLACWVSLTLRLSPSSSLIFIHTIFAKFREVLVAMIMCGHWWHVQCPPLYIYIQKLYQEYRTAIQAHREVFGKLCTWNLKLDQWNHCRCRHGRIITNLQSLVEKVSHLNTCRWSPQQSLKALRFPCCFCRVSEDGFALFHAYVSSDNLDLLSNFHCANFYSKL